MLHRALEEGVLLDHSPARGVWLHHLLEGSHNTVSQLPAADELLP